MKLPPKDISQIEYSPEFEAISVEALEYCLAHGAAKLSGVISAASVDRLIMGVPLRGDWILPAAPEVQHLYDLLNLPPEEISVDRHEQEVWDPTEPVMSHTDARIAPTGISLIIPFLGERAFFGADDKPFSAFTEGFPAFMTVYGPGDAILLRQKVLDSSTGTNYERVHHVGVGSTPRCLATIDISQKEVTSLRI